MEATESGYCEKPDLFLFRDSISSPVVQFEDSEDLKRKGISSPFQIELREGPCGTPSLDCILAAVRQLQQNDIQKTEEIKWLRQRLVYLTKESSRRPHNDTHSWDPQEMGGPCVSQVEATNTYSRDQLSCPNAEDTNRHTPNGQDYTDLSDNIVYPLANAELTGDNSVCYTNMSRPNHGLALMEAQSLSTPDQPLGIANDTDLSQSPRGTGPIPYKSHPIPSELCVTSRLTQPIPINRGVKFNASNHRSSILSSDMDPTISTTHTLKTCIGQVKKTVTIQPGSGDRVNSTKDLEQSEIRQLNHSKHEKLFMAQTQIMEFKKEQFKARKLALKYKHKVPKLLAENLKRENNQG